MVQVSGNSNELAFSIAHDLRNPLSAIRSCAELLVTANLSPEQIRRIAANIRRASEQMKTLLTAIASVAKGRVDRQRTERVFLILITSALEAIPCDGTICITASEVDNRIQVTVEDTGPGIPAEIRCRLFEPFATAGKKDGLGLGLAFSRQAVRDHGGDWCAELSSGARFVMWLPKRRPAEYRN